MLKLTLKGKRRGVELPWANLVNGEAALAVALHASLGAFSPQKAGATQRTKPPFVQRKAKGSTKR
jgi:hypothetical protein